MTRRVVLALLAAAVLAPAAHAATGTGTTQELPGSFRPKTGPATLNEKRATAIFLRDDKVADWLGRYPSKDRVTDATFDRDRRDWQVGVWSSSAGEIATGRVDDETGAVTEAWTGPQVAWKMARGGSGAFGGREINRLPIWLGLCAIFLIGLADFRKPLTMRNLDLVVLLSFSVSLWFFNRGDIFTVVPLAYPPMAYLLARMVWSAWRGGPERGRPVWPVWLLASATVFLVGFRVGLNVRSSNVIDVGYSGVIGAERIVHGQSPYGHMPREGSLKACGPADADGEIRARVQTNGRCESANERGDTYGPVAYESYIPGYLLLGWSGKWDRLPAAHATALLFDLLALLGLALLGRRFGGTRLAATLPFAWAAYPFTQYVSSSNTNDAIMPVFLIFGFWLVTSAFARGAFLGLAGWTKFGALLLVPLWGSYPEGRRLSGKGLFAGGFAAGDGRCVLDLAPRAESRARGARLLGPHLRLAGRPRLAVLDLGLGPVPRRGDSRPRPLPADRDRAARRGCDRLLLRPAPQDTAPAGRPDRGRPDRLRAHAHALVLPLHPVVLPLRRLRRAGCPPPAGGDCARA